MAEERLQEMRQIRLQKREQLQAAGRVPYPSEVRRTHTLTEINRDFDTLERQREPLTVLGRVVGLRRHGGVAFVDLKDSDAVIQLQLSRDHLSPELFDALEYVDASDWLEAAGVAQRTQRGVKTILVSEFHIVSKSIRPLPESWFGLKDTETRYRQREVDLWLNEEVRHVFETRSRLLSWLRQYFLTDGYLEVETPILQPLPGGALARPFMTHHEALDMPLFLKIASELYLKRLLVGGYEKVFEIGRYFRNEGIDRQHNPEFTMLESQWAYADYEDLMDFTENLFEKVVIALKDKPTLLWQGTELSFAKPFARQRYVDLVSSKLGVDILAEKNPKTYIGLLEKHGLKTPETPTYAKVVDELYKELIRPTIMQPTLLYDYPTEMVPWAKRNATDPRIAEMFQLVVHGFELVKAYTELNDPVEQRRVFEAQAEAGRKGDVEAQRLDEAYLRAMEYGMPPNAGWGLGIDRLVMFIADVPSIRDTILFPLLRAEE